MTARSRLLLGLILVQALLKGLHLHEFKKELALSSQCGKIGATT